MSKRVSPFGVVVGLLLASAAVVSAQAVTRIVASYSGASIALLADSTGRLRVVNEGTISLPASCADTLVVYADGTQAPGCDAGFSYVKATDIATLVGGLTLGTSGNLVGGTNTIDQRNAANAQRFNLGNTYTSASVREDWSQYFTSNVFHMGTTTTGATARVASWDYGGTATSAISVPITSGNITLGGSLLFGGAFNIGDGAGNSPVTVYFESSIQGPIWAHGTAGIVRWPGDGIFQIANNAETGGNRIILGTNDTTTGGVSFGKDSGGHALIRRGDGSTGTLAVANVGANSCGTTAATVAGADHVFQVTVGETAGTQCRVTFVAAWAAAPSCWVNNTTTANLARAVGATTTTIDLVGTFVAADVLAVQCDR